MQCSKNLNNCKIKKNNYKQNSFFFMLHKKHIKKNFYRCESLEDTIPLKIYVLQKIEAYAQCSPALQKYTGKIIAVSKAKDG